MKKLLVISNNEFGSIRTINENGTLLFCGSDVAKALGYKRPNDAVVQHCKRGILQNTVHPQSPEKTIEMTFITEGDFYRLVVNSKLPNAEKFEKWVFDEVLPAIRQTGGYIHVSETDTEQEILAKAILISQKTIELQTKKINKLEIDNTNLVVENTKMQPKAEYFDDLVDRNLLTGLRETAKELQIGQNVFIKFLIDKKFLYRDQKGKLQPYASATKEGLIKIKECSNEKTGWSGTQTLITPKGRETFRLLCAGL